jgi:hypothetical protein
MQAGLVSKPLAWSHIFRAGGPSRCLSRPSESRSTLRPTEFAAADLPRIFRPHGAKKGCLINSNRSGTTGCRERRFARPGACAILRLESRGSSAEF